MGNHRRLGIRGLEMYRSTNGRASLAEPEVWFRMVHVAVDGTNGPPVATYREQTSRSPWGPRGPSRTAKWAA